MKWILITLTLLTQMCYATPHLIFKDKEMKCLTDAIYFEAAGEPVLGQWLVGKVILNRVNNGHPPTICQTVHEPSKNKAKPQACQFSFTCAIKDYRKKKKRLQEYSEAAMVAKMLLQDYMFYDFSEGAKYFTRCEVKTRWKKDMALVIKVDNHCFYRS